MEIEFNYIIKDINQETKIMVVEYTAETFLPITTHIPIPFTDVSLEEHIHSHAPLRMWEDSRRIPQELEIGKTGTIKSKLPNANPNFTLPPESPFGLSLDNPVNDTEIIDEEQRRNIDVLITSLKV
jgi:hypothetical protein